MATHHLTIMDLKAVERIAHIVGPSSGAARALADYTARRGNGERVAIFHDDAGFLLVGPIPAELDPVKDN